MKTTSFFSALLLLCAVVAFTPDAYAATISVTPTGDASAFTIQGNSMDGVSGIQLDITYDAASLGSPTVTQGDFVAGAMFAANATRPGSIKVAIIRTTAFSGSGQVARISFATGNGSITSFNYTMIDSNGAPIATSATSTPNEAAAPDAITTAGVPFSQPHQTVTTTATATTTAASTTPPSYLGTVTVPTEQQQHRPEPPTTPAATVPEYTAEPVPAQIAEQVEPPSKPAAEVKAEETPQYVVYKSVMDRFKQFNGDKTLPALAALFDRKIAQNIQQEPWLLISNGQDKAIVSVDIPARVRTSPNFAVNGGRLISFRQDTDVKCRWIVEILPSADAVRVTVTIIIGAEEFEYPLTVSAPIKTALTLDERGWDTFMKEVGTQETPMHDFNNDGIRDSIDEYIFVANVLVKKALAAKPVSPPAPKSAK